MRAFVRSVLRVQNFKSLWRVLRQEGPRAVVQRSVAWVGRLWALYGPRRTIKPSPFALDRFWSDMAKAGAFSTTTAPALLTGKRLVAMIGDLNLLQCKKYRVEQPDEIWAEAGVEYRYAHYQDVPRCTDMLQRATHLMLYRLQRSDLATMYLYEARRLRLPVLYDIDDPLFSVAAYAGYGNMDVLEPALKAHFLAEAPLYLDVMNACDVTSFSTPGLRDHAASLSPRPGFVRRNFADRASLDSGRRAMLAAADEKAARGGLLLALASGSLGHEADFNVVSPQVTAFLAESPDRRLLILGHFRTDLLPKAMRGQVETRPFTGYDEYLTHLARADAALMPLADDLFNRCKSGVRVIDAASVGVPSIVGTVGDMATLLTPGETGFVARTGPHWTTALEVLAREPGMAAQMGRRARADLETGWSARLTAPVVESGLIDWVRS